MVDTKKERIYHALKCNSYKIHNIVKAKEYTNVSNKLTGCCGIKIQDRKYYKYIYFDPTFKYILIT